MREVYLAATVATSSPRYWLTFDTEAEADTWQEQHPTGVIWRADIEEREHDPS